MTPRQEKIRLRNHWRFKWTIICLCWSSEFPLDTQFVLPWLIPDLLPLINGQLVMSLASLTSSRHHCRWLSKILVWGMLLMIWDLQAGEMIGCLWLNTGLRSIVEGVSVWRDWSIRLVLLHRTGLWSTYVIKLTDIAHQPLMIEWRIVSWVVLLIIKLNIFILFIWALL